MNIRPLINELWKEYPRDWQRQRRMESLRGTMADLIMEIWAEMDRHEDYVRRNRLVEIILTQDRITHSVRQLQKAQAEAIMLRRPESMDRITVEMIESARAYPFSKLYQFTRNTARCPFHDDRTPSFVLLKDNRARCYGACGRSWDTIQFVMDRDGLRFPEAVRALR